MLEIFLIILALVWLIFAVVSDLRTREIPNWLNFSLIIFALGGRLFYDIFSQTAFLINSLYVLVLVLLVFSMAIFYLTFSFKTRRGETAYLVLTSLFFIALIYFSYVNNILNKIIFESGLVFSYQGAIGLAMFFVLANLLYHGRFFAGGDTKLLIALGPIIPIGTNFLSNANLFLIFVALFFIVGAIYGIIIVLYFSIKDFRKLKNAFLKNIRRNRKSFFIFMGIGLVFMIIGFAEELFFILGTLIFILPYLFFYTKAIDENLLVRKVSSNELTEGDWLYKDVRVGKNIIKAKWEGLSKREITIIRKKHKFVLIKRGIQFSPVFLTTFAVFAYLFLNGINLGNSLWQP